jgi:uncharacterized protein (TIGR00369 family)
MSLDPQFVLGVAEAMATGAPHAADLGFRFVAAAPGHGTIEVPWREDLVGDPDHQVIAGGVVTALLDHTCGMAIITLAGVSMGGTATLDLRIDYLRPAAPRAGVIAHAHCYKLTRQIGFVRAEAWDVDPADPIATAQAAFMINRPSAA